MTVRAGFALCLVAVTLVVGCAGDDQGAPGDQGTQDSSGAVGPAPVIVATTSILGDVTANIVGDAGRVEILIPAGVDPHDFQLSASEGERLRGADLVIANGLGLEESLDDVIGQLESEGTEVVLAGDALTGLVSIDGAGDPHFWQDPLLMHQAVTTIADKLAVIDPDRADGYRARAQAYSAELDTVHREVSALYASIPSAERLLVTTHAAFGALAQRYGFEIVGVVIPGGSTLASANAGSLADLVEVIEDRGVRAIFGESLGSTELAATVADEVGRDVEIVELYSDALGEPPSSAATYLGLVRANAELIVAALTRP